MPIREYDADVARAATTTDAFNAIAEASRRDILRALVDGEAAVGQLVDQLRLTQPQVSKHLGVLRATDLVRCRTVGRHRMYRLNATALQPIREWLRPFEALWNTRLDQLDELLGELQREKDEP
jgi:DNA-binding transcriptional ArsR family regulator